MNQQNFMTRRLYRYKIYTATADKKLKPFVIPPKWFPDTR